jgi:Spy/CpxP family protein refolding chaperone
MSRLAYLFGATTVLFAGLSVHLALELRAERAGAAAVPATAAAPASAPGSASGRNAFSPGATQPNLAAARNGSASASNAAADRRIDHPFPITVTNTDLEENRRRYLEGETRFLEEIADPARRAELLEQTKLSVRAPLPRVAQYLGLTDEEADRMFTLLAEQQLQAHERQARCVTQPDCNYRGYTSVDADTQQQEMNALLGPERHQKFKQFQESMSERQAVSALRSNLPDQAFLSDQRAEDLVTALYDERTQFQNDALQRGTGFSGYGTGSGMLFVGDQGSLDERVSAARRYSERLRERAAQVLTPEQAKSFNQLQDELLANLREMLRNQERQASQAP